MKLLEHLQRSSLLRSCLLFFLILLGITQAAAQKSISGSVSDAANGTPLIGVSILVEGTSTGTITDIDGNFTLDLPAEASKLIFSYLGYRNLEVEVTDQTVLSVALEEDAAKLDEVIVIGYGQQQKKDLTTAVATIQSRDIRDQPVNSFDQALVGKIAGVQVLQSSGSPGAGVSIRVRGVGSITAGNDPLYVIDGVPVSNDNSRATGEINTGTGNYPEQPINVLSTLNPADIESIQVLKDASAAAIYGSRGSNGVVLITTKKGSAGKATINYNAYYGIQETTTRYDMLNAYEWAEMNAEGRNNNYRDRFPAGLDSDDNATRAANVPGLPAILIPPEVEPYLTTTSGLTDTDWQDEIFRNRSDPEPYLIDFRWDQ